MRAGLFVTAFGLALAWAGVAGAMPSVGLNVQRIVGLAQDDLSARNWTFIRKNRLSVSRNFIQEWRSVKPNGICVKLIEDAAYNREGETFHSTQLQSLCDGFMKEKWMSVPKYIGWKGVIRHDNKSSILYLEAGAIQKGVEVAFEMSTLSRTDEKSLYNDAFGWSIPDVSDLATNTHLSVLTFEPEIAHQIDFDFNPSALTGNESGTSDISRLFGGIGALSTSFVGSNEIPDLNISCGDQESCEKRQYAGKDGGPGVRTNAYETVALYLVGCFLIGICGGTLFLWWFIRWTRREYRRKYN